MPRPGGYRDPVARGILSSLLALLRPARTSSAPARMAEPSGEDIPGRFGPTATVEVAAPPKAALRITYGPDHDADPDAGEVVWTWVPYAERDGRGKDRPVLVIGRRDADTVYAVKLTSKAHDGQRDFLPIGAGPWDSQGRPSWVDVDQFYVVHRDGMRREAAALDLERFTRVAAELTRRYGWEVGGPL